METQRKTGLTPWGPIGSESPRCKVWVQDCWGHSSKELQQEEGAVLTPCPSHPSRLLFVGRVMFAPQIIL